METEGRRNEGGGQEGGARSNVVPFPRDWLGPREDLIPFGPRADAALDGVAADPPQAAGQPLAGSSAAPLADAFWGEDSSALHGVLRAPTNDHASVADQPARVRRGQRARRRPLSVSTDAMPWGRIAAGAVVVVACAAAALGKIEGSGGPASGASVATGGLVASGPIVDLASLTAVSIPQLVRAHHQSHATPRRTARASTHRIHRTVLHHAPAASAGEAEVAAAAPVSSTPATTESSAEAVSTPSPASSGSSQTTATSRPASDSSSTSHVASVRPGPVGPGAAFGPGQLK